MLARHVPEPWPYGVRCRDCHWPHPCAANRLANAVLIRAGLLDQPVQLPPVGAANDANTTTAEPPDGDSPG